MTAESAARPEPGVSTPGSLIVTFAGLYVREIGGWIAVADLISLLGMAGQPPAAVRQAVVRLKSRGFFTGERRDGRAGYRLTALGKADLAVGDARIFRYGEAAESDGWVLAVFSVPEDARSSRHQLRRQLAWLGFGTVSAGVWIAPATLSHHAQAHLQACGLDSYVTWFTGRPLEPEVGRWWDLGGLAAYYLDFLGKWERSSTATALVPSGERALVDYLALVDDWRQFPRIDPGLPVALLPSDWPGRRAFRLFDRLHDRWSTPASDFVRAQLVG